MSIISNLLEKYEAKISPLEYYLNTLVDKNLITDEVKNKLIKFSEINNINFDSNNFDKLNFEVAISPKGFAKSDKDIQDTFFSCTLPFIDNITVNKQAIVKFFKSINRLPIGSIVACHIDNKLIYKLDNNKLYMKDGTLLTFDSNSKSNDILKSEKIPKSLTPKVSFQKVKYASR